MCVRVRVRARVLPGVGREAAQHVCECVCACVTWRWA